MIESKGIADLVGESCRDPSEDGEALGFVRPLRGDLERAAGQAQSLREVSAEEGDQGHPEPVDQERIDDLRGFELIGRLGLVRRRG